MSDNMNIPPNTAEQMNYRSFLGLAIGCWEERVSLAEDLVCLPVHIPQAEYAEKVKTGPSIYKSIASSLTNALDTFPTYPYTINPYIYREMKRTCSYHGIRTAYVNSKTEGEGLAIYDTQRGLAILVSTPPQRWKSDEASFMFYAHALDDGYKSLRITGMRKKRTPRVITIIRELKVGEIILQSVRNIPIAKGGFFPFLSSNKQPPFVD